tara:strand:+ start:17 stop:190 length:174 start_codon:yes stop_codon:yes gene_type:complete
MIQEITQKETENYAKWILTECSDPIDEITWLVCTINQSNKSSLIKQVFKDMKEYNEL